MILKQLSLIMDNSPQHQDDMVNFMMLHVAKGLAFNHVLLAGWEEPVLPHPWLLHEHGTAGLEDGRRRGYVGISRAKRLAIITYAVQRSRFQGGWQTVTLYAFTKVLLFLPIQYTYTPMAKPWGVGGYNRVGFGGGQLLTGGRRAHVHGGIDRVTM